MDIEKEKEKPEPLSGSATTIAAAVVVVKRLSEFWDEFWDELDGQPGKCKDSFMQDVFDPMWHDNATGEEQEAIMDRWNEKPESAQELGIFLVVFASCAYAIQAIKAGASGSLLEAWRCTSRANLWLGITLGSSSIRSNQADSKSEFARLGAAARHGDNRAIKADVLAWLDSNRAKFKSKQKTAAAITRQQPIAHRTALSYVDEWEKLQSAGKL